MTTPEPPAVEPEVESALNPNDTIMLVGAIRAAAITVASALFYMSRVSVVPPFDAKENPFDAANLFDETLNEFIGE